MIAALRAVVEAAVLPPGLFLVLAVVALLSLRYRKKYSTIFLAVALILPYLLSTPVAARWLAGLIEQGQASAEVAELKDTNDAIVVLGCDRNSNAPEFGRDDVSACTLVRLRYAAELAALTGLPVLVSGGNPRGEAEPEAQLMARVLHERFGMEARWLEGRSRNTDENAEFSAEILKAEHFNRVCLVTHAIHMRRAARAFRRAGLQVTPAPTYYYSVRAVAPAYMDVLPSMSALQISTLALHEDLGLLWYVMTGR